MKPLTYREVMDLSADHPDSIRFIKELKDLDDCYASAYPCSTLPEEYDDEEYDEESSLEHFDRYVAGDRR